MKKPAAPAKKAGPKKKSPQLKSQPANPLPPAVDAEAERPGMASQEEDSGFSLFGSRPKQSESPAPSSGSSTSEGLSQEEQRLLDSVPDKIGGTADTAGSGEAGQLAAMVDGLVFKPEHVRVLIEAILKGFAWFFDSEHWEASPLETELMTQPATEMLNYIWLSHRDDISNEFFAWVLKTPGALGLLIGGGIVMGPRISQQIAITRERRKSKPVIHESRPSPQPIRPAAPQPASTEGVIFGG